MRAPARYVHVGAYPHGVALAAVELDNVAGRMSECTSKKAPVNTGEQQGRWKPGQSGNPAGRPKGARNKLSEDFLNAFAQDFEQHGAAVIEKVRGTPAGLFKNRGIASPQTHGDRNQSTPLGGRTQR
jgi:Family of unknown function (DUF5681)